DLTYYQAYNEFLINCINITTETTTNACYNWQYVVDGSYPQIGIDQDILHDGDTLTLYFGQPKKLILPNDIVHTGQTFTVNAVNYDYVNNLWTPLQGVVVGATQTDPNNPWSPIVISTSTTNDLGNADFDITATGTFGFGLEADYYYPTYPFEIIDPNSTTTSTPTDTSNNSGGGNSSQTHLIPDLEKMFSFLDAQQNSKGDFGNDLYTDWAAIAYGTTSGHTNSKNKLKEFLRTDSLDGTATTDYERRAMAMLALGSNPYSDGTENYIQKIVDSFDGNQIGNPSLFNDDIFGIITLLSSGYDPTDEIIQRPAQFIISKQSSNGEWDSVDLTGAAIQALSLVQNVPGASSSISKGLTFLKNYQANDGGFNNPASTSWAVQGMTAANLDPSSFINNGKDPFDYLASTQLSDGSIGTTTDSIDNRIWNTSYTIPAVAKDTWPLILKIVSRPIQLSSGLSSDNIATATSTTTLTISNASTTPAIEASTSTSEVAKDILTFKTSKKSEVKRSSIDKITAVSSTTNIQNTDQLAAASTSSIDFDTNKILITIGSVLAVIGLFSIIFI
ncbi:MAG: hypothetical protein WCO18_01165, partial [bacterium]